MTDKPEIEELIRRHFSEMGGYSAATNPETLAGKTDVPLSEIVKLDANENPYGCSPRVKSAVAEGAGFDIYPDADQTEIRKWLADYSGAPSENIVAGAGSDELIDLLLRLFVEPGDEVITAVPTFDMYRFSTQVCGGKFIGVKRNSDFTVNLTKLKEAVTRRTKLIFLANPNNPTGTLMSQQDILEVVASGLPVVIDEAYYEFSGETAIPLVNKYDNLIVLRTFSKWAGLAGLRVGYGVFPLKIARWLMLMKPPYSVNAAAQVAVRESLKDRSYLLDTVNRMKSERERLFRELSTLKMLKPVPTRANFILCSVVKGNAKMLKEELQKQGILIRYYETPLLQNYIRISVGKPEHTDRIMQVLRKIEERTNG